MNGSTECELCGLGTFGAAPGVCAVCPAGQFQDDKGQSACLRCPSQTFRESPGAASRSDCLLCSTDFAPGTTTGNASGVSNASLGCVCASADPEAAGIRAAGFFRNPNVDFAQELAKIDPLDRHVCLPCPEGALCAAANLTLEQLPAQPGFWRASVDIDVFIDCQRAYKSPDGAELARLRCCPGDTCLPKGIHDNNASMAFGDPNEQCGGGGYTGTLCRVCADGFVMEMDGVTCAECSTGPRFANALLAVILLCAVVGLGLVLFFVYSKSEGAIKKSNTLFGQLKIAMSFLQILSSMPRVFDGVPWPAEFESMVAYLQVVNFDFLAVFSLTECSLAVPFLETFVLHMLLPVLLLITLVVSTLASNLCLKDTARRSHRREQVFKIVIVGTMLLCESRCLVSYHYLL